MNKITKQQWHRLTTGREQRLLEAVADIAYIAGGRSFYSGDSRKDISDFIEWAVEFESHRNMSTEGVETYHGDDYMTAIEKFALKKLTR